MFLYIIELNENTVKKLNFKKLSCTSVVKLLQKYNIVTVYGYVHRFFSPSVLLPVLLNAVFIVLDLNGFHDISSLWLTELSRDTVLK